MNLYVHAKHVVEFSKPLLHGGDDLYNLICHLTNTFDFYEGVVNEDCQQYEFDRYDLEQVEDMLDYSDDEKETVRAMLENADPNSSTIHVELF